MKRQRGRAAPAFAGEGQRIEVGSGYGFTSRLPFVELVVGEEIAQLTAEKAREIASWLLAAAEAAEGDGFILEFMQGKIQIDERHAAGLLSEFRAFRKEKRRAQQKHDAPPADTA